MANPVIKVIKFANHNAQQDEQENWPAQNLSRIKDSTRAFG
ncbi:MAG: hypothetical protein Q8M20_12015 [Rhodocyclaceae bacterium]|nr:hypothetical protein [Rhodocyclaceae bacterium]MDZ4214639.1 hypothetical protein [Rhodocyclaceae bacterium]